MNTKVPISGYGSRVKPTAREKEGERPREVEPFSNKSCVVVVRDQTAAPSSLPLIYKFATNGEPHWMMDIHLMLYLLFPFYVIIKTLMYIVTSVCVCVFFSLIVCSFGQKTLL